MDEVARLSEGKYLSLTTFKRDGSEVSTPVYVARNGDRLYVITQAQSGKAKRLRHTSRVLLAPCTVRGTETGPRVTGTATLLDGPATADVRRMIGDRYGVVGRVMGWLDRTLHGRGTGASVGIEIQVGR